MQAANIKSTIPESDIEEENEPLLTHQHLELEKRSDAPAEKPASDFIRAWDGLRGYFTFAVILAHLHIVTHAWLMIGFFFTISGLIITSMTLRVYSRKGAVGILNFYQRRIARLVPSAMLVLFAVCLYIFACIFFMPEELTPVDLYWLRKDVLWSIFYGQNWELIVKGEDYFQEFKKMSLLRHFWSLAIEEQYYILWPILLTLWITLLPKLLSIYGVDVNGPSAPPASSASAPGQESTPSTAVSRQHMRYVLFSLLFGELVVIAFSWTYQAILVTKETPSYVLHYSTFVHMKEFAVGGLFAVVLRLIPATESLTFAEAKYVPQLSFWGKISVEILVGGIFFYLQSISFLNVWESDDELFEWYFSYGSMLVAVCVAMLASLLAVQQNEVEPRERKYFIISQGLLSNKLCVFLGSISYQTYLWHLPVIVWTNSVCVDGWNNQCMQATILVIVIVYVISVLGKLYFENLAAMLILQVKSPLRVIGGMFVSMCALAGLVILATRGYQDPYAYVGIEQDVQGFNDDASGSSSRALVTIPRASFQRPYEPYNTGGWIPGWLRVQRQLQVESRTIDPLILCRKKGTPSTIIDNHWSSLAHSELAAILRSTHDLDPRAIPEGKTFLFVFGDHLRSGTSDILSSGHTCGEVKAVQDAIADRPGCYIWYVTDSFMDSSPRCNIQPSSNTIVTDLHTVLTAVQLQHHPSTLKVAEYFTQSAFHNDFFESINHPTIPFDSIKFAVYALVNAAVAQKPEVAFFFSCSVFENYARTEAGFVLSLKSSDAEASKSNSSQFGVGKDRIVFLGDSHARRFGHAVETIRSDYLMKCPIGHAQYSKTSGNYLVPILNNMKFGTYVNTAQGYIASEPLFNEEIGNFISANSVTTVVVSNLRHIAAFLDAVGGNFEVDNSTSSEDSNESFRHILNFVDALRGFGVKRVYLEEAHWPTNLNLKTFGKFDISEDNEAPYRALAAALERKFNECEAYLDSSLKRDYSAMVIPESSMCFSGKKMAPELRHKLLTLKSSLRLLELSKLVCPKPVVKASKQGKCTCPRGAWGFDTMLSDGAHVGGDALDFVGINILSELAQDIFADKVRSGQLAIPPNFNGDRADFGVRRIDSPFSLLSTPDILPVCQEFQHYIKHARVVT